MSQVWYISYAGKGGEIQPVDQQKLDTVIRSLSSFVKWDEKYQSYRLHKDGWYTLAFCKEGLLVQLGGWDETLLADLDTLVKFARSLGMTMFGDEGTPDDQMSEDEIEQFLRPWSPPTS